MEALFSMRYRWLIFTLFLCLALGRSPAQAQIAPAANPTPRDKAAPAASSSNVAPEAAVVTIDGLCGSDSYSIAEPGATPKASDSADSNAASPQGATSSAIARNPGCRTIITRSQFEKLASVITPGQPPQAAVQLARFYSEQLLFAREARELGLDKDPHFDDVLKFTYLQVLARAMNTYLQQQADIPDTEFEKYYKEHAEEFEQVQLLQVSIPKHKHHATDSRSAPVAKAKTAPADPAMKAEAEKIYRQVLAGGDFEKLQTEAYTLAGDPDDAPDADMGIVSRPELGESQKEIFAMRPGQISRLISGDEAWHIFKVVSKPMMSQSDAKKIVTGQRLKATMESLKNSVKPQFNDAYFGTSAGPEQAKSTGNESK
jgi:hypothetical protein